MLHHALAVAVAGIVGALTIVPDAVGATGSISNLRSLDGARFEATYTTTYECVRADCGWYARATQVPAAQACSPSASLVYVSGPFMRGPGTIAESDDFYAPDVGAFRVCLYVSASDSDPDLLVADSVYEYRPRPVVRVSRLAASTNFSIAAERGVQAELLISYRGRTIQRFVRRSTTSDSGDFSGAEYRWSCFRLGEHQWTVRLTHVDASVVQASGRFRVPGRCGSWHLMYLTPGYATFAAAREFSPEYVSGVRCSRRGRHRGARATAWACQVEHANSFRRCTTDVSIRRRERVHFGRLAREVLSLRGRSRCRAA